MKPRGYKGKCIHTGRCCSFDRRVSSSKADGTGSNGGEITVAMEISTTCIAIISFLAIHLFYIVLTTISIQNTKLILYRKTARFDGASRVHKKDLSRAAITLAVSDRKTHSNKSWRFLPELNDLREIAQGIEDWGCKADRADECVNRKWKWNCTLHNGHTTKRHSSSPRIWFVSSMRETEGEGVGEEREKRRGREKLDKRNWEW